MSGQVFTADGRPLYTLAQLAEQLDVPHATLRTRRKRGQLGGPTVWLDGRTPLWTKENAMTTTTSYGTWNNQVERYSANLATTVVESLGDYGDEYDVNALTADYRDAINTALPASVTLAGDEFIGPHQPDANEWDGYPTDEHGQLDIKAIVDDVDFWEIARKHER